MTWACQYPPSGRKIATAEKIVEVMQIESLYTSRIFIL